jgi:hypothetical protein
LNLQQEAANQTTLPSRLCELAKANIDLARIVALNPSTPPELLEELADSLGDAGLDQSVIAHFKYNALAKKIPRPRDIKLSTSGSQPSAAFELLDSANRGMLALVLLLGE